MSPLPTKTNRRRNKKSEKIDDDDNLSISSANPRKSYIKNCIKKKFNRNYEKQINCVNDEKHENVVFTDNKIYISLTHRRPSLNSSFGANSSSRSKERIIYPSSASFRLTGFLRNYDFNYDYKSEEEQRSEDEKLKFDVIGNVPGANIVFEKVKFDKSKKYISRGEDEEGESKQKRRSLSNCSNSSFLMIHMSSNEDDIRNSFYLEPYLDTSQNNDSLLTNTTFIAEWNNYQEISRTSRNNTNGEVQNNLDEDELQWKSFLEVRKKGNDTNPFLNNINLNGTISDNGKFYNTTSLSDDSGIGRSFTDINKNHNILRTLDTWLDDENFDNSFNEELERRVQIDEIPPNLHKTTNLNNI